MKRRTFILHSAKFLAGANLLNWLACQPVSNTPKLPTLHAPKPSGNTMFVLEEMTIDQLQKGYKNGNFTISEIVKCYLDKIEDIDKKGPALNAIIQVNPDAMEIAKQLEDELKLGKSRGALHGVPIILKDNIGTKDGMFTTAGSRALIGSKPLQDSQVATKLRAAGAIILAKANLSEWANFRANISSSGWSGHGGQTKNPYRLDRNPCGSSSGSGVAVSANMCMLAIGTETNGSIVCPSNNNGVVGIKPTVGLVGRSGIIPISFTQDTAGPMARTVRDAAICLGALTGIDERDSKTNESTGKALTDYTTFLKKDGLKGKKIGLWTGCMGFHFKVDKMVREAVEVMKAQGAEVIEIEKISEENIGKEAFNVLLYEFKDGLNKYFDSLGADVPIKSLEALIEFNKKDDIELRYFDQNILEKAQALGDLNTPEYKTSLHKMLKACRENGIDKVMNENGLDAIVAPTGAPAWKTDLTIGDNYIGSSSSPAARSGYPNITVPMGFINELPVGISIFGRAWTEGVLLEVAYAYEQATKHRKAPEFLKN